MKKCPKCAERIQSGAQVCRYCGQQQPTVEGNGALWLIIGGVLLFVGIANSLTGNKSGVSQPKEAPKSAVEKEAEPSTPYSDVGKQYAWNERSKDQIRLRLKDADSAQFKNVHFYSGGGVPVNCGEVNSKNSFGGYSGFERFIAAGSQLAVVESDMTVPSELDEVWNKMCVKGSQDKA